MGPSRVHYVQSHRTAQTASKRDPPRQLTHPRTRVVKEAAELRPAAAGDVEAAVQEALEVALALPVLALLGGQARAVAAQVSRMVAAGEPLVRKDALAAPAEMTAPSAGHGNLLGRPQAVRHPPRTHPPYRTRGPCAILLRFGV